MASNPIPYSTTHNLETHRFEWIKENRHLCRLPWTSLQFFFQMGTVTPCCNLLNEEKIDYFKPLNEIRQAVEAGQTHPMCQRCYQCEDDGKSSERIRSMIGIDSTQLQSFLHNRTIDNFYIHATLSSLCNMACRSCHETVSSLYNKIWANDQIEPKTMSDDPRYWQTLLDSIVKSVAEHKTITLVISGGEGLVQPDFFKLIDWLIENNLNDSITLQLNTNGSINDKALFENLTTKFRRVRLVISVDSVYENYYYVRWPVKWEKIKNNLNTFVEYKKTLKNFEFILTPVFSINNIFYLSEFIRFFDQFADQHQLNDLFVYDTPLYNPEWLDIQFMPAYLKEHLASDLSQVMDNKFLRHPGNVAFYTSVSKMLEISKTHNDNPTQAHHWDEYLNRTARWDKLTNADLSVHNIKLYRHLSTVDLSTFEKYKLFHIAGA